MALDNGGNSSGSVPVAAAISATTATTGEFVDDRSHVVESVVDGEES